MSSLDTNSITGVNAKTPPSSVNGSAFPGDDRSRRAATAQMHGAPIARSLDEGRNLEEEPPASSNGAAPLARDLGPALRPSELARHLDRFVIANAAAKKAVALAAYYHQLRMRHTPGCEMVERVLRQYFEEGKQHTDQKFNSLTRSITAALRASPISNRRDSRARKDVCALLRLNEDSEVISPKGDGLPASKRSRKLKRGAGKGVNAGLEDQYAAIIAEFVSERRTAERKLSQRSRGAESSRDIPILIGQSGSGKSALVRHLAARLDLPFAHIDASQLTEAGWRGLDAESIPQRLLASAERLFPKASKRDRVRLASHGIVFLDEIDKKAWLGPPGHEHSRTGAQASLLLLLDGYVDHETGVDLGSCLFILGGSFSGASVGGALKPDAMLIAEIVEKRLGISSFGFSPSSQVRPSLYELLSQVNLKDLINFGIIPELAGRVQPVATEPMTVELLMRIMEESRESPLRIKTKLLGMQGIDLRFTEDGRRAIAEAVLRLGLGARPLRLIFNRLVEDLEFSAPDLGEDEPMQIKLDRPEIEARLKSFGY